MNRANAEAEIKAVFGAYKTLTKADRDHLAQLAAGKLYELYVLAELLKDLVARGFTIAFSGASLKFKSGGGMIKSGDPHFEIRSPRGQRFWAFVDIEFETLGSTCHPVSDLSRRHELDIVIVDATPSYPQHDDIVLAVECKSGGFAKHILKEVLGIRRELSFVLRRATPSILTAAGGRPGIGVPARPASEFWLAFVDPAGLDYAQSPAAFGIEFRQLVP